MKIGVSVVNRNDGYKDFERGLIHFKSMLDTFDEVNYIDWNSPEGSFLWEIEDKLPKTGKIKHFIIPPSVVTRIVPPADAQKCNEGISRNIGIRRSDCDWIVSTNIDIIAPKREDLEKLIEGLDENTFYTVSRREAPKDVVYKYGHLKWKELREELYKTIPERHFPAKVTPNDNFSLINCCGDFQLAHKNVWEKVKGFEEKMYYACFLDTNVQKKAILNNFKIKDLYNPPVFHIEHGGYSTTDKGERIKTEGWNTQTAKRANNDALRWVEYFNNSENDDDWGLFNTNIEYETF